MRTEPRVSLPIAAAARPFATEAAAPDDEPPGDRLVSLSKQLTGIPIVGLMPRPE